MPAGPTIEVSVSHFGMSEQLIMALEGPPGDTIALKYALLDTTKAELVSAMPRVLISEVKLDVASNRAPSITKTNRLGKYRGTSAV